MLNEDYRDILQSLADEHAKFLLVDAYALAAHGDISGRQWISTSG